MKGVSDSTRSRNTTTLERYFFSSPFRFMIVISPWIVFSLPASAIEVVGVPITSGIVMAIILVSITNISEPPHHLDPEQVTVIVTGGQQAAVY